MLYTTMHRKPLMLDNNTYTKLKKFINAYSGKGTKQKKFSEAIELLLRRYHFIYTADTRIRDYVLAFVSELSKYENIHGILLFGSVAKNSYSHDSDIDLMVLSSAGFKTTFDEIEASLSKTEKLRVETLLVSKMFMGISPMIVTQDSLEKFNPIYFDLADFGIPLFDRNMVLENFLHKIGNMPHKRRLTVNGEILEWSS